MTEFKIEDFLSEMDTEPYVLFVGADFDYKSEKNKKIINLPWSCIITSLREDEFSAIFNNNRRLTRDLVDEEQLQQRIFDKMNLSVVRLFSTDGQDPHDNDYEYGRKEQTRAYGILNRITGMMRTSGSLIIVGYGENDRLDFDRFLDLCESFRSSAIYFFGESKWGGDHEFFDAVKRGRILFIKDNLESFLPDEDESDEEIYIDEDVYFERIYIENKIKQIDKKNLFNIKRIAIPVSVEVVQGIKVSPLLVANYFYQFLKESPFAPQWYGFYNKFNLVRHYEKKLYDAVVSSLEKPGNQNQKPICLAGQSGSGKSIALGYLAYRVFNEKKYPVVFIQNNDISFLFSDTISSQNGNGSGFNGFESLSQYLDDMKHLGAKASLVILDVSVASNKERENCIRLFDLLKSSRGHNLQLVFSSYEFDENDEGIDKCDIIKTSPLIEKGTDEERELRAILKRKAKMTLEEIDIIIDMMYKKNKYSENLMSLLYRIFYEIRPNMELGIRREATSTIQGVIDSLNDDNMLKEEVTSLIAQAFKDAYKNILSIEKKDENKRIILKDEIKKLLVSVAICSEKGLPMPSDLAYRLLPSTDYRIVKKIMQIPFFVFKECEFGDYEFWIRTQIEAKMLLRAYQIDEDKQTDVLVDMIKQLRSNNSYSHDSEVNLMVRLLHYIGPNSEIRAQRADFLSFYPKIIKALKELREESGGNPRLTLQEIVYIREYSLQVYSDNNEKKEQLLQDAIRIGEKELLKFGNNFSNCTLKDMVTVEINNSRLRLSEDIKYRDITTCRQIQRDCVEVVLHNPESSYAYSTMMRAALLEYDRLPQNATDRAQLLARYCDIIERIRGEHPELAEQQEIYSVANELYSKLSDITLSESYFQELLSKASDAGIYIRAKKMLQAKNVDLYKKQGKKLTAVQLQACESVCNDVLLNPAYENIVMGSANCQQMLLRLKWLIFDGEPIFVNEKQYTYIKKEEWHELLEICLNYKNSIYNEGTDYYSANTMLYVLALCYAQVDDFEQCRKIINLIRKKTDTLYFKNRIRTNHILCNPNGVPKEFQGKFVRQTEPNETKGYVQLDAVKPSMYSANGNGIYYHQANMKNTIRMPGQGYSDFQMGLGYMGLSVFRGLENDGI